MILNTLILKYNYFISPSPAPASPISLYPHINNSLSLIIVMYVCISIYMYMHTHIKHIMQLSPLWEKPHWAAHRNHHRKPQVDSMHRSKKSINAQCSFTADIMIFWLLKSFCLLFQAAPWAIDAENVLEMYLFGLSSPGSFDLCIELRLSEKVSRKWNFSAEGDSYIYPCV